MNRNRPRKSTRKQQRVLHQIESSPYARLAVRTDAPVETKVYRKESDR